MKFLCLFAVIAAASGCSKESAHSSQSDRIKVISVGMQVEKKDFLVPGKAVVLEYFAEW